MLDSEDDYIQILKETVEIYVDEFSLDTELLDITSIEEYINSSLMVITALSDEVDELREKLTIYGYNPTSATASSN